LDPRARARRVGLFLQERIALLDQFFKLLALLRNAVGVSILILGARECSSLLDKLPDILTNDGDVLFELRERRRTIVAHHVSPARAFEWSLTSRNELSRIYPARFDPAGAVELIRPPIRCEPMPANVATSFRRRLIIKCAHSSHFFASRRCHALPSGQSRTFALSAFTVHAANIEEALDHAEIVRLVDR
jgi:hypothetical protein